MNQLKFCTCFKKTFHQGLMWRNPFKINFRSFICYTSRNTDGYTSRTKLPRLLQTYLYTAVKNMERRTFISFPQRFSRTPSYLKKLFLNSERYRDTRFTKRTFNTNILSLKDKTVVLYLTSAAVFIVGFSYAAVPLYRLYCQASGYGGTTKQVLDYGNTIADMERIEDRMITIRFEAGTNQTLQWKFKPQQKEVTLSPGETALAFYKAENLTDRPIIGIATYNVVPFDAGQYFNKIQCFCFEEQQLNPHEEVDMPVFFYIDPEFVEDPKMAKYDEIILSYVFFESNDKNSPVARPH